MPTQLASASTALTLSVAASRKVNISLLTFLSILTIPAPKNLHQFPSTHFTLSNAAARMAVGAANNTLSMTDAARRVHFVSSVTTLIFADASLTPGAMVAATSLGVTDAVALMVPRLADWRLCLFDAASVTSTFHRSVTTTMILATFAVGWTNTLVGGSGGSGPISGIGQFPITVSSGINITDVLTSNFNASDESLTLSEHIVVEVDRCQ